MKIRFLGIKKILFLMVGGGFLLIASGWIDSIDGMAYVTLARNMAYYGKVSMPGPEINTGMMLTTGTGGAWYSPVGLGWSLMLLPVAYLTKLIYWSQGVTPSIYFPLQSDYLLTFFASLVNPLFGFGLFIILYKIFRRYKLNFKQAFGLALMVSLTTNLLPLAKHSFAHLPMITITAAAIFLGKKYVDQRKMKDLIISGFLSGLALITYNYSFLLIPLSIGLVGLFDLIILRKKYFISGKEVVIFGLSTAPWVILMCGYNYLRFGNIFDSGYQLGGGDFIYKAIMVEGVYGLWFSSGRGLLVYSPVVIVAVIWAFRSFKISFWSRVFGVIAVMFSLFYGRLFFWSGELSYGPRYMSPLILFTALVIAENWKLISKTWLVILTIGGAYVQLVGIVIPYQTQYPSYDSTVYVLRQNYDRKDLFDYWAVGEFIPRYSPPYRLKKILICRLINTAEIFFKQNDFELAGNVSPPIKKEEMALGWRASSYKRAVSKMGIYSFANREVKSLAFDLTALEDIPINYQLCNGEKCIFGKVVEDKGRYKLEMEDELKVKKGDYLELTLGGKIKSNKEFGFEIKSYEVNGNKYGVDTYRLVNTDNLFWNNEKYLQIKNGDLGAYGKLRGEFQNLVDTTPDFWWIKAKTYVNLPAGFLVVFYVIIVGEIISGIIVVYKKFKK